MFDTLINGTSEMNHYHGKGGGGGDMEDTLAGDKWSDTVSKGIVHTVRSPHTNFDAQTQVGDPRSWAQLQKTQCDYL